MLIERVLLSGHFHPCKDDGTTAGDDVGQAFHFFEALGGVFIDSYMDSQEINAVFCVHFRDLQPFFGRDFAQRLVVIDHGIVDRHGSDDGRALGCQLAAELLGIAEGA